MIKQALTFGAALTAAIAAFAQAPVSTAPAQPPPPARGPSLALALEAAQATLDDCVAKGHRIGVSVVDSAGVLKVVLAADGASSRGVQSSANTNFNARAGGVLLKAGDELIGAIGVGGARGSENDEACALTGVRKIQARLE